MKYLRLIYTCCFLIFSAASYSQTTCDSNVLEALKTKINVDNDIEIKDALYSYACNSKNESVGGTISIMELAFGANGESAAQACAKNDREFFLRNKTRYAVSFLPQNSRLIEEITKNCFSNLTFQAAVSVDGNLLTFKVAAVATTGEGKLPKLKELRLQPGGVWNCPYLKYDINKDITPVGKDITCERKKLPSGAHNNGAIKATLVTSNMGNPSIYVPQRHIISQRELKYDPVKLNGSFGSGGKCSGDQFPNCYVCKNTNFNITFNKERHHLVDKVVSNRDAEESDCQRTHGRTYLEIDGVGVNPWPSP